MMWRLKDSFPLIMSHMLEDFKQNNTDFFPSHYCSRQSLTNQQRDKLLKVAIGTGAAVLGVGVGIGAAAIGALLIVPALGFTAG